MSICCRSFITKMHRAYPIAASIATSAAACIPGTVANECVCPRGSKEDVILGHAGGYTTVNIKTEGGADPFRNCDPYCMPYYEGDFVGGDLTGISL